MYLDPGGVSLFFQALVATIIAVPFVFRRALTRGFRRLVLLRRPGSTDQNHQPES
jgi:hypothetical protein